MKHVDGCERSSARHLGVPVVLPQTINHVLSSRAFIRLHGER